VGPFPGRCARRPSVRPDTGFCAAAIRGRSGTICGMELIRSWLRLWRVERVELTSPMSLDEAEALLAAAVETIATASRADFVTKPRIVFGWVRNRRIRVSATPPGISYAWNTRLRAELMPASQGCRLIGRLGWGPVERVFSAFWLACVLAFFAFGLVLLARAEAHGDGTGGYLPMCLVPVAIMAFYVGLIGFLGSAGRKNGQFLLNWLHQTLQTRDSESPDHDGPIHQSH
jgi:nitrogen fixation-related uncharacterized protein